ncbi:DNA-deoxyinosine glycosylase [Hydrogenimonas sp.]
MSSTPKSSNDISRAASTARHPFDPILPPNATTLILGSFPSLKSFENDFYYAHPRNQFWPLLSAVYAMPAQSREERVALLERAGLALWDVVAACERTNSADTNLKKCRCNDIPALLQAHPTIGRVLFTGKKAMTLFRRCFPGLDIETGLLPSPSPAYAAMPFEEKLKRWRAILLQT